MTDPTKQYTDRLDGADKRVKTIIEHAESQFPTHSRKSEKLTPEQQRDDYLQQRAIPGGMQKRLREWRQTFGLNRAVKMFVEWDKEFHGD